MHLEWILSPLAIYTVIALSLAACLALFIGTKMEMAAIRGTAQQAREAADSNLRKVEERIENLATPPGHSLNLTKRAQALRMHRRGEPVANIAATLSMPTNEIQLLIKLSGVVQ